LRPSFRKIKAKPGEHILPSVRYPSPGGAKIAPALTLLPPGYLKKSALQPNKVFSGMKGLRDRTP